MPVDLFEGFTNPLAGETFRCRSYNKNAFSLDWLVEPEGYVPFEHVHLSQDEIFYVKTGELKIVLQDKEFIIREGQSIIVPKGTRHIAYNNKPELLHCEVDYVPGLDNYRFFQCFAGLTIDGDTSSNGTVNIPKMLYFTKKMRAKCLTRPTKIPAPLFYLSIQLFYFIGIILGWNRFYTKYTGKI